ncbi:hypothetical protein Tco_1018978 [Tanacetum coccineum]|uniref:Uncharacterized protein n=1 Tax=Tanacetum coccineum TaxID=301880 RepID=A0ABQ5FVW3_9ASTR
MPGRPKKKRIRPTGKGGSSTRVSKVGVLGRPRKNQSVVNLEDVDGSKGGAGGFRGGVGRSRGGASRSRGGAGGSKEGGKKKVGTSGFAKWFGLQDELKQTHDEPEQTQDEPVQTQDEDQVEQTQEQVEINLTQVEQTQEQTQDQVQIQEQPQRVILRRPSARIL